MPPALASATDLADLVGRARKSVLTFLTRYADKHTDCRTSVGTKRRNEPAYLYLTEEVWEPLLVWAKRQDNDDDQRLKHGV